MDKTTRQRSNSQLTYKKNEELRRENSRLRKQLQKLNGAINSLSSHGEATVEQVELPPEIEPLKTKELSVDDMCPKCAEELKRVEFGVYIYLVCIGCKYREKRNGTIK